MILPEDPVLAVGIDPAASGDPDMVIVRGVHLGEPVSTLPEPLPLCWVAEGKRRGATDDEWAISYDHEALPKARVTADRELVSCRECREWIHA